MQIKVKLLLWYLAIQTFILASFNYALFLNVEHNLHEKTYTTLQTHEMVEHFLTRMWILDPFILLLSSIGGYVLVSKYFQPIQNMLQEIKAITPNNLSLRIQQRPYNDEINHLAIAFNEMLDRLEKAFHGVKEFNTHASHELRTPLTIMRGEIEIALRKERTVEEYKTILETQLEEIKTLQKLMEDLLFLAEYNAMETQNELEGLGSHAKSLLEMRKACCTPKVSA
ncbi:histidine kinase dimerization/phospho-acceptor domain-containing protein [Sulfurospirillum arsenophilum]|uniref:histidine kinase dimerization/phospho-acceptor domain-containing protein n=1 Tax=Sulfurospirillum arsenophilum TaxID=56698 RepID=UPI0006935A3B|nr:histidine kinase dimerization/phospho-acceptor domain-containing protein [Sulfurospirillum arsenophilum]